MGTTWNLSCSKCNHNFYSGRLQPFLHNNALWATQNSLHTIGLLDTPLLFSSFFLALGALVFLPAPLQIFLIAGLILIFLSIIFRRNILSPFKYLFSYFEKILDSIIKELSFQVRCNKNDKCPKCKCMYKSLNKDDSCTIV